MSDVFIHISWQKRFHISIEIPLNFVSKSQNRQQVVIGSGDDSAPNRS